MKPFNQIKNSCGRSELARFRDLDHPAKCRTNSFFGGSLRLAKKITLALCLLVIPAGVCAQKPSSDLTTKSIEDLMDIEVTSVSKKEEKLFQTAAAVYVITREDIHRSGLTSIPELLRLAPGVEVARIDGTKWAVSARGFNGRLANKILVLIDGRSVYSPETSGVYWEVQDLLLEDIERIEVVRGPGGTLWGANAVNGVINIITKHTSETRGGVVATSVGSEERGIGFRYGANLGDNASYRVYGKYFNRSELVDLAGRGANDGQQLERAGGRIEWQLTERDGLSLEGDIYRTNLRENSTGVSPANPFAPLANRNVEFSGGHIMGRWTRTSSSGSSMALQAYYDRFSRRLFDFKTDINTFDVDFQHHTALSQKHDLVWGLGFRRISQNAKTNSISSSTIQFNPSTKTVQLFSAFAQDDIAIVKDRLQLILGIKLEHNYLTGFEAQPSIRLSWTPSHRQTAWAAISRAIRTSARSQQDIRVNFQAFPGPGGLPVIATVFGGTSPESEILNAYELGYRARPHRRLSLDIATFYNVYRQLTSFEPGLPFFATDPIPHLVVPSYYGNLLRGETYGVEAAFNLDVTRRWKLHGSYSFLRVQLHPERTSADTVSEAAEGADPRHQFQLHSYFNLGRNLDLDTALYRVSSLRSQQVPGYTRIDSRIEWRIRENFELSGGVQNLLDNRHLEFNGNDVLVLPSQVRRSVYGKILFRF